MHSSMHRHYCTAAYSGHEARYPTMLITDTMMRGVCALESSSFHIFNLFTQIKYGCYDIAHSLGTLNTLSMIVYRMQSQPFIICIPVFQL